MKWRLKAGRGGSILLLSMLVVLAGFTGCGTAKESGSARDNGGVRIVTSFYPMYLAAINIVGDIPGVTVSNMTESQTGCLHDYTLTTRDMKSLEKADFFIINGAGMESFMDKVLEQKPGLKIIEASKGMTLLKDEKTGDDNPHVWVSISGAIEQVRNIGEQLAAGDSAHAAQYEKNTQAYIEKLDALRKTMHEKLDGIANKKIVTFHEAFPYFAKEFNLDIRAVIEREPGTEPSAGELANTIDLIKESGVKALFAEPQYPQKSAELIAKDTGVKVHVLDPVVTGDANGDRDAYLKAMEANLKSLEEALSGND